MATPFLYAKVYDDIYNRIASGEYEPGQLLPFEKELCRQYSVSLITVRRALNELEENGIISKIKGKGSVVNTAVHPIRRQAVNNNVGILVLPFAVRAQNLYPPVPFDNNSYNLNEWHNIICSALCSELLPDCNPILGDYSKDEIINNYDRTFLKSVDRLLLLGAYDNEIIQFLQDKGKLVVVYNNFDKHCIVTSVLDNERHKCREAVECLIGLGHRHIAAINGDISFSESLERFMGYQEALMASGFLINTSFIKWGDMTSESGYHLMKQLLSQETRPTAVICVNDNVAAGAIIAIREAGLKCPDDISIIGHDNNAHIAALLDIPLSTIDPNYLSIGKEIAAKLKRDIWIDDYTVVECRFIRRESIAPPPGFLHQSHAI